MTDITLDKELYLKIDFGNYPYLLPYEEALQMLAFMKNAVVYEDRYNQPLKIYKLKGKPKFEMITSEAIKEKQMEALLENK